LRIKLRIFFTALGATNAGYLSPCQRRIMSAGAGCLWAEFLNAMTAIGTASVIARPAYSPRPGFVATAGDVKVHTAPNMRRQPHRELL
jgi:hypothetical protein